MSRGKARRSNLASQIADGFDGMKAIFTGIQDFKKEFESRGFTTQPPPPIAPMQNEDPYSILGMNRDDPWKMIKEVYLVKSLWFHPDSQKLQGGDIKKFQKLSGAYEMIKKERGMK